ncbi:hypothetical protein [Ahrensia sp. R2A130]|uniref:hypothetical protein n=1 Tax=Ahrensia sp. R2A130 TaxID=744979 RepID=UPI0001E0BCC2|nr:hypothetical protein [Ahrensia sp. R2A130]EFL88330.1 conserved hypothetical protein [Ahrensia sp. R2A130]
MTGNIIQFDATTGEAIPAMKHPAFIPSLNPVARYNAIDALEGGIGYETQYLAQRLDTPLDGAFSAMFDKLEAATEFATKQATDGDRFQIIAMHEDGTYERVGFDAVAPFHFGIRGSVGDQYRDDGRWFTNDHAVMAAEQAADERCPWSGGPVATVREVSRATAKRRSPNFGDAGSGSGRLERSLGARS